MKKLITILLTLLLALGLCACDSGAGKSPASGSDIPKQEYPSTGSDLTNEEIQKILAEMEAANQ